MDFIKLVNLLQIQRTLIYLRSAGSESDLDLIVMREFSSAGLEHYLDKVGVTGSSPVIPTIKTFQFKLKGFLFYRKAYASRNISLSFATDFDNFFECISMYAVTTTAEATMNIANGTKQNTILRINFIVLVPF
jgi:hypothetical protein